MTNSSDDNDEDKDNDDDNNNDDEAMLCFVMRSGEWVSGALVSVLVIGRENLVSRSS